jgi:hydrogenase maturation protease
MVTSWLAQDPRSTSKADAVPADGTHPCVRIPPGPPLSLVLGFGNILLSDDGAGVKLVERLRAEIGDHAAVFIDGGTLSFSLLSYIEATNSMLVVDAADVNGAPGTVRLFEDAAMDEFLTSNRRRTVHEVGLIDLLDMARLQDCLPPRRALLCIQPQRIDWSEELSATVAEALPAAAHRAIALLKRWQPI